MKGIFEFIGLLNDNKERIAAFTSIGNEPALLLKTPDETESSIFILTKLGRTSAQCHLEHILKISMSTFILMTTVLLAGCDNQGTIPNVLAQIDGSHQQLEITCKRLTLVDNEGTPRLTLFTGSKTGDPGITMSGNSGTLHMHLGTHGVRVVMATGPGEARIMLEADDSEASITLIDENGRIELIPPRK
jgi:hypothetical protein